MHGPAMSSWLLMALCGVTGAYCLLRMGNGTREERRTARAEALMGFGMAAMAVPAAVVTPPVWGWAVYVVLFGGAALRALWFARHKGHHLHHLVCSSAMVYMALAMTVPAQGAHGAHGAGSAASGLPLLTGVLLLYYTVYVLRSGARLVPVAAPAGGASQDEVPVGGPVLGWAARPELAAACRLSMALAMLAMLVTL